MEISTSDGNVAFGPGAVFVPLVGQDADRDTIHALVSEAATEDGVAVWSVTSGSTADGTPDIGDGSFRAVQRPEVLVLFDDGLALYDAGEVWHQLDHRMHIPDTLRRKDEIGGLDWSRYTHLIIVGGRNTSLSDSAQTRIAQWVREEGGTIIATRQAAAMAQETFLGLELPEDEASEEPLARRNYADMPVSEAEHVIGGALFAGDMDPSHPIGFGYQDRSITLHRNTTLRLARPDSDPFAVVVEYTDAPLLSGYASQRRQDEIAGTPAVIAQRLGAGTVVLFADNPNFRATFRGTEKMFMNAIFFGNLVDRARGDYRD